MPRQRTGPARLAEGFVITATDFFRAVQIGGFLPTEHYLLGQAHELAWAPGLLDGSRQPRAFRLNYSALSRVSGNDRKTLARAHSRLVMYQVFAPEGDGSYWIQKDYARWLDPDGQPRFSPEQLAWIQAAGRPIGGSGCNEVGRSCAPVRTGAPAPLGGGAPAPQSPTTGPSPQVEASTPLDGAGAESASARAKKIRKEKEYPPGAPPRGGKPARRTRGSSRGINWSALEALEGDDDGA